MLSTKAVCNALIRLALRDGIDLSPMKLQRILYIAAAEFGHQTGDDMLAEPWATWPYGPANQNVFDWFASHSGGPITKLAPIATGQFLVVTDYGVLALFERVWNATKGVDGATLSRILRGDGSAWLMAFQRGETHLGRDAVLTDTNYQEILGLKCLGGSSNSPEIPDNSKAIRSNR